MRGGEGSSPQRRPAFPRTWKLRAPAHRDAGIGRSTCLRFILQCLIETSRDRNVPELMQKLELNRLIMPRQAKDDDEYICTVRNIRLSYFVSFSLIIPRREREFRNST